MFGAKESDVPYHMIWVAALIMFVWWLTRDLLTSRRLRACLEQPLLQEGNGLDHRIDAANEEAMQGFVSCPTCGFENFSRTRYCARCSACCTLDVDRSYATTSFANHSSAFLRRIRRRLEWQRKVDVRGRVFWYRDAVDGVQHTSPGYVMRFWRDEDDTESTDSEDDDDQISDEVEQVGTNSGAIAKPAEQEDTDDRSAQRHDPQLDLTPHSNEIRITVDDVAPDDRVDQTLKFQDEQSENSNDGQHVDREEPSAHEHDEEEPDKEPAHFVRMRRKRKIRRNPSLDLRRVQFEIVEASKADASKFPHDSLEYPDFNTLRDSIERSSGDFPSKFSLFVSQTAALLSEVRTCRLKLPLQRDYILEQSMNQLACIRDIHARLPMRIRFRREVGVDVGGLHREWFMLLNEMLTKPHVGLFKCTNRADQTYYINANSAVDNGDDHLVFFFGAGRMVGRALLDGAVLGFHLSVPLLKLILGVPVTFDDLEYYDAELYRNLKWLLENDGVDELGLDFSVCEQRGFGRRSSDTDAVATDGAIPTDSNNATADVETVVVDLIPNGRHVSVTDENKALYVDRRFKYVLFESVWEQLCVFLRGVYDVIPVELLVGFDYEELDYLLCGTGEIDVDDWEQHTRISLNLEDNPRVLRWFWELVREMDGEARRRLLHFSTGSSRVPLVGFKGLTSYDGRLCPFTLKGVAFVTDQYIRSHACFNMLDLPLYRTKEEMRLALYGLLDSDMYGFTTA
ncbi:hypothetical protein PINS_up013169 [Pythium insidiosum]|nr:hypothetical protein PINS_up013169 [Pythium insidiosum]